jgi:uncharacterized membrane protein YfcA
MYLLVGLVVGTISGALGIGGGVLLIPALYWLFGFNQYQATGTTLAILVPPIGLAAALEYYQRGQVDLRAAAVIAAAFVVGAYIGAKLVPLLPEDHLRLLFGLMLIYVGVRFILASHPDAAKTYFGLLAVGFAWLGYFGLRVLGRRYMTRPELGQKIRQVQPPAPESDYYI